MDKDVQRFIFASRATHLGFVPPSVETVSVHVATSPVNPKTGKIDDTLDFEEIGYVVGGLVGGILYSLSAPIVLLDGPLPFVDAAWAAGFGWAVYKGATTGGRTGRAIDSAIDLV